MAEADPEIVLLPVSEFLIVPLPGPLSDDLLGSLRTRLLDYLGHTKPEGVVLDMAGIQTLDAHDLEGLKALVVSAGLMGARVVFSTMQPGAAAGAIMLGVDTSWLKAARTVEGAMALLR
jgi:rsbT antagonist protein RsbS